MQFVLIIAAVCFIVLPTGESDTNAGDPGFTNESSIDTPGDTDLDGRSCTRDDLATYLDYLVNGITEFSINTKGQKATSDMNRDGKSNSAADFQLLINCFTAGQLPAVPGDVDTVSYSYQDSLLILEDSVSALYLTLPLTDISPRLLPIKMEMRYAYTKRTIRTCVVVYSLTQGELMSGIVLDGLAGEIGEISASRPDGTPVILQLENESTD